MSKLNFIDCIRSKYKYTDIFYDEMATVVNWNELCGFINKNGEEVIKCQYNSVLDFHSGLAAVKNSKGLWGYIDKEGNEVIPCQFLDANDFSDSLDIQLAPVMTKDGWIYINKNGEQVLDKKFVFAGAFSDEYAIIQPTQESICYYMNGKTYEISREKHKPIECFPNGIELIMDDKEICLINEKFEIVSQKSSKFIRKIYPKSDGLYRFIDLKGNIGYLDDNLNEKIAPLYQRGSDFREGLACVTDIDGKIHYIDKFGNIQFTIDTIYNGVLELDDKTIYISATSEQKFKEKKLQVLKLVKEEMINKIIDNIDNLAYDHTNGLYQYTRSKKKN